MLHHRAPATNVVRVQTKLMQVRKEDKDALELALVEFEKQRVVQNYKFGVLYAKDGQTTDVEMFCNRTCLWLRSLTQIGRAHV